jgi:hypothetical protein
LDRHLLSAERADDPPDVMHELDDEERADGAPRRRRRRTVKESDERFCRE